MKRGDKIRVIANRPAGDQKGIGDLIGKEFPILKIDRDDKTIQIPDTDGGEITLNKGEFELVKP